MEVGSFASITMFTDIGICDALGDGGPGAAKVVAPSVMGSDCFGAELLFIVEIGFASSLAPLSSAGSMPPLIRRSKRVFMPVT